LRGREELIANCRISQSTICDCSEIDTELEELRREIEVVAELSKKAIYENARVAVSQEEFNERNHGYQERHRQATERVVELKKLKCERNNKSLFLETFIKEIETRPLILEEFDDKLWAVTVEKVKVMTDGRLVFSFKDGTEIEV
jgi:site-specific DNA recombinase